MLAHDQPTLRPEDLLAHAGWLRQLALGLVRGAADPEDLVQATYLAALRRPPEGDLPIRRWLAQVLRNVWKMRVRSSNRRVVRENEFAAVEYEGGPASPEALLARFQTQRLLGDLVAELEEPYRSTVLLRYQEGLSSAEIARTQNVPAGTVRWRLMTGLEKLREALDAKNEGDRRAWMALLIPFGKPIKAAAVKGGFVKVALAIAAGIALSGSLAVVGSGWVGPLRAPPPAPRAGDGPRGVGVPVLLPMPLPPPSSTASTPPAPALPPASTAPPPSKRARPPLMAREIAPEESAPLATPATTGTAAPPSLVDPSLVGGTKVEVVNGVLAPGGTQAPP